MGFQLATSDLSDLCRSIADVTESGTPEELSRAIAAIRRVDPEPIRDHWVDVEGVMYPAKQAHELVSGESRSHYNSHHALAQLRKVGFVTSVYQRTDSSADQATAFGTAEVEFGDGEPASVLETALDTVDTRTPGTWRVSDESAVPFAQACAAWAVAAHSVLSDIATRYNDFVTYGELAQTVQDVTGIRTRMQMRNWIGKVLAEVVREWYGAANPT